MMQCSSSTHREKSVSKSGALFASLGLRFVVLVLLLVFLPGFPSHLYGGVADKLHLEANFGAVWGAMPFSPELETLRESLEGYDRDVAAAFPITFAASLRFGYDIGSVNAVFGVQFLPVGGGVSVKSQQNPDAEWKTVYHRTFAALYLAIPLELEQTVRLGPGQLFFRGGLMPLIKVRAVEMRTVEGTDEPETVSYEDDPFHSVNIALEGGVGYRYPLPLGAVQIHISGYFAPVPSSSWDEFGGFPAGWSVECGYTFSPGEFF